MRILRSPRTRIVAQIILGVGLVAYAIQARMIDWNLLWDLAKNPTGLLINFFFLSLIMLLLTQRWYRWTRTFALGFTYGRLLNLGMASAFLCTFLPSSVGNDLAKIGLGIGDRPERKAQVLFTVFLDRLIGLYAMLVFPGLVLLFFPASGMEPLSLPLKITTLTLLAAPLTLVFVPIVGWLEKRNFYKAKDLAAALRYFQSHRRTLLGVLAITLVVTTLNIGQYLAQATEMGLSFPVIHAFWMIPLGLLACALPFLPLGIGIGQVAFFHLFQLLGWNGAEGATLVTAIQGYSILFNLTGVVFYFGHRPMRNAANTNAEVAKAI